MNLMVQTNNRLKIKINMVICNEKCILYGRCEFQNLRQRCIFDIPMEEDEYDDDTFIEKLTY